MNICTDYQGRFHFVECDITHLPTGDHINGLQFFSTQYVRLPADYFA